MIDITHGVPRHDVRAGAVLLAEALPYVPAGVHLAVVDPDVGAARRAVALECEDGRSSSDPTTGCCGWPRRPAVEWSRRPTSRARGFA